MSSPYKEDEDGDYFPRTAWGLMSKSGFMRTTQQECCIYPVRIYDADGNVKKDVSVKTLMKRQDKKIKTKGNFHAPL